MTRNDLQQFATVFVLRIEVVSDARIVTRFETYLFDALTAQDAFRQAVEFAPTLDYEYRNSDGEIVTIKCCGIHELDLVEPNGDDYRGLVSSAEILTPNGAETLSFVKAPTSLACFNKHKKRSDYPNLDQ